jgi:hypothetical protein
MSTDFLAQTDFGDEPLYIWFGWLIFESDFMTRCNMAVAHAAVLVVS